MAALRGRGVAAWARLGWLGCGLVLAAEAHAPWGAGGVGPDVLPASIAPAKIVRIGPWGTLELSVTYLEPPAPLLAATPKPDQRTVWHFPQADAASLRRLGQEAGLSASALKELLAPESCVVEEGGLTVLPSPALVVGLAPGARQVVYEALARTPGNPYHEMPQLIFGSLEEWLGGTGLSERQRHVVRQTVWRKGGASAFNDRDRCARPRPGGKPPRVRRGFAGGWIGRRRRSCPR